MAIPKVKNVSTSDDELDKALRSGLDEEGLIRMKAVDLAVSFFKDKQVSDVKHFQKTYEEIYKFIKNLENEEDKLHSGGIY
jgi:hypothetical protein